MFDVLIGFCSGIISGMGIGGGAILIPALVFFDQVAQQTAQGINLVYFLPTAVASLIIHIRNKNVDLKTAAVIGGSGILGAAAGAWLAMGLSNDTLRKMFGWFLMLIGLYEIIKGIRNK